MGTKGTLIMKGETESYYFPERRDGAPPRPTNLEVTPRTGNALVDASESRVADAAGGAQRTVSSQGGNEKFERVLSYRNEINAFCASIRTGTPLTVGTDQGARQRHGLHPRLRGRRQEDPPHARRATTAPSPRNRPSSLDRA